MNPEPGTWNTELERGTRTWNQEHGTWNGQIN